ncbi:MAG: cation-translocating P-type ATPase [Firmicutes bacterium]|nr:cation-translocating P-type ATPase [Bacillota bacterium]
MRSEHVQPALNSDEIYQGQAIAVAERLGTDITSGLTEHQVTERLHHYGLNKLEEAKKETLLQKLIRQFMDFMVLILVAACVVSGFLGDWVEAIVIIAIVIVNAILGVYQEGRAEKAVDALQKMASPKARVLRGGKQALIDSVELVPGDIVLVEAGDIVPADIRLLESYNLKAEEASLTGESVPVEKDARFMAERETLLGDRSNMLFSSTNITYGKGKGVVAGTGLHTEIGRIADRIQSIKQEATPLQENLNQLGKILGTLCLAVSAIVFIVGILRNGEPLEMFMTAVSLAVAAIPEGLQVVVTIVLALGMKRMADRHAIVKRLLAVETLGSVDVICSDKTGTLTQNEMTVTRMYAGNDVYEVSGVGYAPNGKITNAGEEVKELPPILKRLLEIATLCNDAELQPKKDGTYGILGDPTEGAMLTAAEKAGITRDHTDAKYPKTGDLPFDSERKMMSVFHKGFEEARILSLTKGAPDIILDRCISEMTADGPIPLTDSRRQEILAVNTAFAQTALRVLAFAYRTHEHTDLDEAEKEMTFVGMMGMIDPSRPEARDAIALCTRAGIRAVMITGDHKDTAVAIARDLGLMREGDGVLSGKELDEMSDDDLRKVVEHTAVFARVSPEHKVKIVAALRDTGHIDSMTGDGVNDAPALKQADIGVAMGITGTEVAKGTADMILTDDNFATIVAAVEEGRVIFSNIRKFVSFLLSCNVGEILVIFITTLLLGPAFSPLSPIQLLWLNLLTDSFPALALGAEAAEKDIMECKPRKRSESIINKDMIMTIVFQSIAIFGAVFTAFEFGRYFYPDILANGLTATSWSFIPAAEAIPSHGARTFAFVTLITAELLRAYSSRSTRHSVFSLGFFSNKSMVKATLVSLVLLMAVIYVDFLDIIFETLELLPRDWGVIIPLAVVPFVFGELFKWIYFRGERRFGL